MVTAFELWVYLSVIKEELQRTNEFYIGIDKNIPGPYLERDSLKRDSTRTGCREKGGYTSNQQYQIISSLVIDLLICNPIWTLHLFLHGCDGE